VATAEGVIDSLMEEVNNIDVRLPILEAEKKLAASKRDFKGAGKASREMKEAQARKEQCIEEMEGEAKERVNFTKKDLEKLEVDLEEKKSIAHEKEKEKGIKCMVEIAKKIKRLSKSKDAICKDVENNDSEKINVVSVGNIVLSEEIKVLHSKGESLDEDYGGWTGILEAEEEDMEDAAEDSEPDSNEIGEGDVEKESDEEDTEEKEVSEEIVNDGIDEAIDTSLSKEEDQDNEATENEKDQNEEEGEEKDGISKETVLKWKELTDEISEIAILLETAVEKEEYDEAAEFDEKIEIMKADINGLGFSDDEFQAALEAMDLSSD